jgi:FtsH-binding integral membrane protein
MILAGLGAIAYSYIGAFAKIGEDMSLAESPFTAFFQMLAVMESIASGDIPQMTGFLYAGLLFIAVAVVTLFFGRSRKHDDADIV